jgi:uncharacterized surface protein with fasciclin (FAS1) repeats
VRVTIDTRGVTARGTAHRSGTKKELTMRTFMIGALAAVLATAAVGCKKSEDKAEKPAEPAKPAEPTKPAEPPKPAEPSKPAEPPPAAAKDILTIAAEAGSFKTLEAAVTAAGLVETLKGPGPFTVFAPTDEAFAKIPKADLDAILADKAKLTAILTYHVVPGKVMSKDVAALKSAKTVNGAEVTIDTSAGVKIDNATVVKADIEASNGVIHVIDTVIVPK